MNGVAKSRNQLKRMKNKAKKQRQATEGGRESELESDMETSYAQSDVEVGLCVTMGDWRWKWETNGLVILSFFFSSCGTVSLSPLEGLLLPQTTTCRTSAIQRTQPLQISFKNSKLQKEKLRRRW